MIMNALKMHRVQDYGIPYYTSTQPMLPCVIKKLRAQGIVKLVFLISAQ
jgi:hypothetical protein